VREEACLLVLLHLVGHGAAAGETHRSQPAASWMGAVGSASGDDDAEVEGVAVAQGAGRCSAVVARGDHEE
jgi:hypothetical protein